MGNSNNDERDFLDDSWQTRRFVSPSLTEEEKERKTKKE